MLFVIGIFKRDHYFYRIYEHGKLKGYRYRKNINHEYDVVCEQYNRTEYYPTRLGVQGIKKWKM